MGLTTIVIALKISFVLKKLTSMKNKHLQVSENIYHRPHLKFKLSGVSSLVPWLSESVCPHVFSVSSCGVTNVSLSLGGREGGVSRSLSCPGDRKCVTKESTKLVSHYITDVNNNNSALMNVCPSWFCLQGKK